MEVELKVKLRAVVEDDVQLASVEPGRPCQRPLHEVQVARVPWLERTAGANNLKIRQIRFLEKKSFVRVLMKRAHLSSFCPRGLT